MPEPGEKVAESERAPMEVVRPLALGCSRTCGFCGASIAHKRRNARYCDSTCRAEATHVRRGSRPGRGKALRSAAKTGRRSNRKGVGTYLYVVGPELELVRHLLSGKAVPSTHPFRGRLEAKIPAALERVERRAA